MKGDGDDGASRADARDHQAIRHLWGWDDRWRGLRSGPTDAGLAGHAPYESCHPVPNTADGHSTHVAATAIHP